jgi:hypothetical protein
LEYQILSAELFVCQMPVDAQIPPAGTGFFSVTRTDGEVSVVCESPPPGALKVEAGWTALEIVGPLDFALTGVLVAFAAPLADAGISIFAISTFHTDYLLVRTGQVLRTVEVLAMAGHRRVSASI